MGLNDIYNFFYGFIIFHPIISMAIAVAMGILIYLKPNEIIKVTAIFAGILIIVYLLSYLTGASRSGYLEKEKGMYKTMNTENDRE
ncbi:MAG: hypothetical protein MUE70_14665 [Desulfobacterales bacterium]|nr:hypothetical protein [Desulfobacterales bacterium]